MWGTAENFLLPVVFCGLGNSLYKGLFGSIPMLLPLAR